MHPDPRRIIPVVLLVVVAIGAIWYLSSANAKEENGAVTASGTIETTEVELASETGGKVDEVLAVKGESVRAGDVLVRFNDEPLEAQRPSLSSRHRQKRIMR
jgi:HlyD family secretion protein